MKIPGKFIRFRLIGRNFNQVGWEPVLSYFYIFFIFTNRCAKAANIFTLIKEFFIHSLCDFCGEETWEFLREISGVLMSFCMVYWAI